MQAPQGAGKSARRPGSIGEIRTSTFSFPSRMRQQPALFASRGKKPWRGEPAGDARPRVTRALRVLADRGKLILGGLLD